MHSAFVTTPSLPKDSSPVAESIFLAYSCAAARDFHPLPCLHRAAKTRVPKESDKDQNNRPTNLTAGLRRSQIEKARGWLNLEISRRPRPPLRCHPDESVSYRRDLTKRVDRLCRCAEPKGVCCAGNPGQQQWRPL